MSLKSILTENKARANSSGVNKSGTIKEEVTEERLIAILPQLRHLISFFREYPDLFIDFIKGPDTTFQFYWYQRILLRGLIRHKFFYCTAPRAFSKSFITMLSNVLKAILYPNSDLFVTTGGKEQAASITMSKVSELCRMIPSLEKELKLGRGEMVKNKDTVMYNFKNGSRLGNLAAKETSRGQRRTGGTVEEAILIDPDMLNEVVIPTTAVNRLLPDGSRIPEEHVNKSLSFITTAGYRNTFAYKKLQELFVQSVAEPDESFVLVGTYVIPEKEGLIDAEYIDQLKLAQTFKEETFQREMGSEWTGGIEDAFFSSDAFDRCRTLKQAEVREVINAKNKDSYYVIGVDVGRVKCTTEAVVIKVNPQKFGSDNKNIVNIYTYEAQHFEEQAVHLKKLFYAYNAKAMIVDGNGIGMGLVDFLVKENKDPLTWDLLPPFGIINDENNVYKNFITPDTQLDAVYVMKANAPLNTEMYTYCKTQIASGRVRFLIDELEAKNDLVNLKTWENKRYTAYQQRLRPYVATTVLKEQMCNLIEANDGANIILKQSSKGIKKDKFSALIYGLYYVKMEEDKRKSRKRRNVSDMMFFG